MAQTVPSSRRALNIRPRVKLWLEVDGQCVFCAGLCQILKAVDERGSIKDAAAQVGRSYRFVWGRIKEAEQSLGRPLVETRVGGNRDQRSSLTDAGRRLLTGFLTLRERLFDVVDHEGADRFHLPSAPRSSRGGR